MRYSRGRCIENDDWLFIFKRVVKPFYMIWKVLYPQKLSYNPDEIASWPQIIPDHAQYRKDVEAISNYRIKVATEIEDVRG